MTLLQSKVTHASYSDIASEYYDEALHPTCANFRQLSLRYLNKLLERGEPFTASSSQSILETGAGLSVFAGLISSEIALNNKLVLQDRSCEMLAHSLNANVGPAEYIVCDARQIPVQENEFDLIVSSLADPYNDSHLWGEISRVIKPGGSWILTTPSIDWAGQFREKEELKFAEFLRADGQIFSVPSFTYSVGQMINSVEAHGARIQEYCGMTTSSVAGNVSEKLNVGNNPVVVDCYWFSFD